MKKLILLTIPLIAFAFTSKFLQNIDIHIRCDRILRKKAFDICYSCKWKTPKMIIYNLDGKLINSKNLSREFLHFKPDYNLPNKCRSYSRDYSKTGFDRGHNAPNAAFDYDKRIQKETFLMSNIAPQKPKLNRNLWTKIERFARYQARRYKKIGIITGVCGSLGNIRNKVNIPAYWYKCHFQ